MTSVNPSEDVIEAYQQNVIESITRVDIYEPDGVTPWMEDVPVIQGDVSGDASRSDRRVLSLTLSDRDNLFSDDTQGLYYDKIIKPYKGIRFKRVLAPWEASLAANPLAYLPLGDPNVMTSGSTPSNLIPTRIKASWMDGAQSSVSGAWAAYPSHQATRGTGFEPIFSLEGEQLDDVFTGPGGLEFWFRTLNQGTSYLTLGTLATVAIGELESMYAVIVAEDMGPGGGFWYFAETPPLNNGDWHHIAATWTDDQYWVYLNGVNLGVQSWDITESRATSGDIFGAMGAGVDIQGYGLYAHTLQADQVRSIYQAGHGQGELTEVEWNAPLGVFHIDNFEFSDFPKSVSINCRDKSKLLERSRFHQATGFEAGDSLKEVLRAIVVNGGVYDYNMDFSNKSLAVDIVFDADSTRLAAVEQLAEGFGLDVFFDPRGVLQVKEFADPSLDPVSYSFLQSEASVLTELSKSRNDTRIYNSVAVVAESSDSGVLPVWGVAKNEDPDSPTSIPRIGERTLTVVSSLVSDEEGAIELAERYLAVNSLEEVAVEFSGITLPWLTEGTVIEIEEEEYGVLIRSRYLLSELTIPLGLGAMTGTARRVMKV